MRQMLLAVAVAGASSVGITSARAQDLLLARADSLMLHGDSLGALRLLDDAVRENSTNAAVWHRRGVLAWRLSGAEKRTGFMKREANDSLLALADSSLLLATRYGVNSPDYLVDLGRFYLTSNSAKVRSRATKLFEQALKAARKSGDSAAISRAADEMGMTWWRRYEDRADRHIYSTVIHNVKDRTRERLSRNARDGWAWLANGLAEHRLHEERAAAAAFDSALKLLPREEVERYDRLTRIFTPKDSS